MARHNVLLASNRLFREAGDPFIWPFEVWIDVRRHGRQPGMIPNRP